MTLAIGYEGFRGLFRDPRHAADYDRTRFGGVIQAVNQKTWGRAIGRLLAEAAPRGLVLDLPCGTGRLASVFRGVGVEAVGVDLSEAMLERARAKGATRLLAGEAERLPLKDGAVDGVVSLRFLSHPPKETRARILREMARVARRFVIVDVRYRNPVREALRAIRRAFDFRRGGPSRARRPDLEEIRAAFLAAGFADVRIRRPSRLFSDNCLVFGRKEDPGQSEAARNPDARPSQYARR